MRKKSVIALPVVSMYEKVKALVTIQPEVSEDPVKRSKKAENERGGRGEHQRKLASKEDRGKHMYKSSKI